MTTMTHQLDAPNPDNRTFGATIGLIALVWVAVVVTLAINGVFDVPADDPALPSLLAIALPVSAFALATIFSTRLRNAALAIDPVLLVEFQAWRIMGGAFLIVYAFGHLPGLFAWPAGLGDVAVGIAAPFMAWRLRTGRTVINSTRFKVFNYLGLADFVVAVVTGIAAREQITGLVDQVTSIPMAQFPLVLIPAIAVPGFIIMHIISLMQAAQNNR